MPALLGHQTRIESLVTLAVLLACFSVIGCGRREPITSYTVERDSTSDASGTGGGAPPDRDRMVVGIAIHNEDAWFFKLAGEKGDMTEVESAYRGFLESIKFDDSSAGVPRWETPEGWVREPGNAFRFASLKINDKLKVSISTLTMGEELESYLRINIDRWRREMGLRSVAEDEPILETVEEIEVDWGRFFILDHIGLYSGGAGGGGAPFANRGGGAPGGGAPGGGARSGGSPSPTANRGPKVEEFKIPEGWETAPPTSISLVSLGYEGSDGKAGITISALSAAGNNWQDNVVRWAGIVAADSFTAEELGAQTEEFLVDGAPAKLVQLPFSGVESASGQSIVAVMAVDGEIAWFVRLAGDSPAVESQLEAFRAFLQSIKFAS